MKKTWDGTSTSYIINQEIIDTVLSEIFSMSMLKIAAEEVFEENGGVFTDMKILIKTTTYQDIIMMALKLPEENESEHFEAIMTPEREVLPKEKILEENKTYMLKMFFFGDVKQCTNLMYSMYSLVKN